MWCIADITPEYRERMYFLLDLYEKDYNPLEPVLCVDEKSKQLLQEVRSVIKMKPGRSQLQDYEYKRNGTRNIFISVEPKGGKRKIKITKKRGKEDFAKFIKELIDKYYPDALKIYLVLDNLNTHFAKSFYETFGKEEAERVLSKIIFCYTPKHASWLNMAEIEINVMDRECTKGRIKDEQTLKNELKAWEKQRNKDKKKIKWTFRRQDADKKLSKHYVA